MTSSELQTLQRVSAIDHVAVFIKKEPGQSPVWQVKMQISRIGLQYLEDQSGKIKTFKSLDTVFETLGGIGIRSASVIAEECEETPMEPSPQNEMPANDQTNP